MKNLLMFFIACFILFGIIMATQSLKGNGILSMVRFSGYGGTSTSSFWMPYTTNEQSVPANPAQNEQIKSVSQPTVQAPEGFSVSELSPYYGKVHLSSVSHPYSYADTSAQFTVSYYAQDLSPVSITGWRIKGNGAYGIELGTAIADFQKALFGYTTNTHGKDPIVLRSGGSARFYSWVSAMNGASFRLNKCTGYLNESYAFNPSLPNECPRIDSPRLVTYSGKCQDFIRSLSTCRTPNLDRLNQITGVGDVECKALAQKQNYDACYNEHHNDADFFSNEWRVWMNQQMPFDFLHDRLVLYDAQGLVVDIYTY